MSDEPLERLAELVHAHALALGRLGSELRELRERYDRTEAELAYLIADQEQIDLDARALESFERYAYPRRKRTEDIDLAAFVEHRTAKPGTLTGRLVVLPDATLEPGTLRLRSARSEVVVTGLSVQCDQNPTDGSGESVPRSETPDAG